MYLSTFVFSAIYCLFAYAFMMGMATDFKASDKRIKPFVLIIAPFSFPYSVALMAMTKQRYYSEMLARLKAKKKREDKKISEQVTAAFIKDLEKMSAAMTEAFKGAHPEKREPFTRRNPQTYQDFLDNLNGKK